jgi:VanZ family protein
VETAPAALPERKPLAILCILAVIALLWATIWPFNPYPNNNVTWVPDANGLRFDRGAIVFSDGPLRPTPSEVNADACTIEIYLRTTTRDDSGNLLTFSSDKNPEALYLRQAGERLRIDLANPSRGLGLRFTELEIANALPFQKPVLLTISSGSRGLVVYKDGKILAGDSSFQIHPEDLYGQIVIGNSPTNSHSWRGEFRGLAIYDEEVSPADVAAHYAHWSGDSSSTAASGIDASHLLARYDFRERSGNVVHSEVASAPPLTIPQTFFIPRKPMLDSVRNEFEWTPTYRHDVIVNIVGFMPLGFVLCGFFALSRSRGQAILISTLCGGLLSFSIEFLQYYIPERGSGWTDVVTNTTGTLLGALIAHPELVRFALRLVHLIPPRSGLNRS